MQSPFVVQQAGYLTCWLFKQGVFAGTAIFNATSRAFPCAGFRKMLLKGVLSPWECCFPPCHGGLSPWSASKPSVGFAARPWLPLCPPGHSSLSLLPRSPHTAQQQDAQLQGLIPNLTCSFGPQATSILTASADIPGEESKVLTCFGQPWHPGCPLPPGPALVAGREAGREDFRAAEVPRLLSHHLHVAAHEQLCEQPASGPATFQWGTPPLTLEVQSEETSLTLLVPKIPAHPGMGGAIRLGQDLGTSWPWGTPLASSRRQQLGRYAAACKAGRNQDDVEKQCREGQKKPCLLLLPAPLPWHPQSGDAKISAFV